jgi:hypothetical protein
MSLQMAAWISPEVSSFLGISHDIINFVFVQDAVDQVKVNLSLPMPGSGSKVAKLNEETMLAQYSVLHLE